MSLEPKEGVRHRAEIAAGGSRTFYLALQTNEFAQIALDSKGVDLVTSIYDPKNNLIHQSDWRWVGIETVSWIGDSGGPYRIEVSNRRRRGVAGEFVLTLLHLRPRTELDLKWIAAEKASTQIKDDIDKNTAPAKLEPLLADALTLWQALNYTPGIAQILNARGFVELALGKPLVALESLEKALALRRADMDIAGEGEALHNMASAESALGEIRKARDLYQEALELRRKAGDPEGALIIMSNLGIIHFALGESDEAVRTLSDALLASPGIADFRLQIQVLNNLGGVLAGVGETEDALNEFRKALILVKDQNDPRGEAYVLGNLGKIYSDLADYSRALPNLKRTVELMRTIGDKRGEGTVLINLGSAYYFDRQPQLAIPYFEQSLAILRETKDRLSEARALQRLSRAYNAVGEIQRAVESNAEGRNISASLGDPRGEAAGLRNLAEIEYSKQEFGPAIEHLNEARSLFQSVRDRNGETDAILALARISRDSGKQETALTQAEEALNLIESQRQKVASSRLRGSYFASKREYYDFYIDLLMSNTERPGTQQAGAALEANERARARLLLDTIPLSRVNINIRNSGGQDLDDRKRRLYREINRIAQQLQTGTSSKAEIASQNQRLESLFSDVDDVQAQIITVDPRYQQLISPPLLRLSEIQNQLDPETLLLEYNLGEDRSFLWALTKDSITAFSNLPRRSEIEQLVRSVYDSASARSHSFSNQSETQKKARLDSAYATYRRSAALLSEKLLGPVADRLGAKRLIIVSDGALNFLPFAALPAPGNSNGSSLIESHEVVNVPSISVLAALRKELPSRPKPAKTLAVIADPVYSADDPRVVTVLPQPGKAGPKSTGSPSNPIVRSSSGYAYSNGPDSRADPEEVRGGAGFRRLIYSRQEARTILSLVPPSQSHAALDFEAGLPAVTNSQLGSFRIVHFGVHGMFDSVRPSLSSLVLSLIQPNGQPNDGFLRLYQIYNLNLPVDLVVLGACETAMGTEIHGEGLESIARGFMYAGAARLVASLWQVDDESTSELMKAFYRNVLGKSPRSPAAALRQAQLEIMRNPRWREPYYWGGFVFIGDWQ